MLQVSTYGKKYLLFIHTNNKYFCFRLLQEHKNYKQDVYENKKTKNFQKKIYKVILKMPFKNTLKKKKLAAHMCSTCTLSALP